MRVPGRNEKKMSKITQSVTVAVPAGRIALTLRNPESIALFPGVRSAVVGHPGMRLSVQMPGRTFPLKDSVLLSWHRPRQEDGALIYPFGIEGGRWLHGEGVVRITQQGETSTIEMHWQPEPPLWMRTAGGGVALRKALKAATRQWLDEMKRKLESPTANGHYHLTALDVGA